MAVKTFFHQIPIEILLVLLLHQLPHEVDLLQLAVLDHGHNLVVDIVPPVLVPLNLFLAGARMKMGDVEHLHILTRG